MEHADLSTDCCMKTVGGFNAMKEPTGSSKHFSHQRLRRTEFLPLPLAQPSWVAVRALPREQKLFRAADHVSFIGGHAYCIRLNCVGLRIYII